MGNRLTLTLPKQDTQQELVRVVTELLNHTELERSFCIAFLQKTPTNREAVEFRNLFVLDPEVENSIQTYQNNVVIPCNQELATILRAINPEKTNFAFFDTVEAGKPFKPRFEALIRRVHFYDFFLCYFALAANSMGSEFMKGIVAINKLVTEYIGSIKTELDAAIKDMEMLEELIKLLEAQYGTSSDFNALIQSVQNTVTNMGKALEALQTQQTALKANVEQQGGGANVGGVGFFDNAPSPTMYNTTAPTPLPTLPLPIVPAESSIATAADAAAKKVVEDFMKTVKAKHQVFDASNKAFASFVDTMLNTLTQYMTFINMGITLFKKQHSKTARNTDFFAKTLEELKKQPNMTLPDDFQNKVNRHFNNVLNIYGNYNQKWVALKDKLVELVQGMEVATVENEAGAASTPRGGPQPPSSPLNRQGAFTQPSKAWPGLSPTAAQQPGISAAAINNVGTMGPVVGSRPGPNLSLRPEVGSQPGLRLPGFSSPVASDQAFQTLTGFTNAPPG